MNVELAPSSLHCVETCPAQNFCEGSQVLSRQASTEHTLPVAVQSTSLATRRPSAAQVWSFLCCASQLVMPGLHTQGLHETLVPPSPMPASLPTAPCAHDEATGQGVAS